VLFATILADTEDHGVGGGELVDQPGEFIGLDGAAGGVVFGIKIKHDIFFAAKLREADIGAILIDRGELWCGLVYFEHGSRPLIARPA
jgi:hypothetical protein